MGVIEDLTNHCLSLCTPAGNYSVFESPQFHSDSYKMLIGGSIFDLHKIVFTALKHSRHIVLFAGTCGDGIEQYAKTLLKNGNALEGLIVDLIASELAEGIAELIHSKVREDMITREMLITNRYSPGYCNWPVSDQQQLFELLASNNPGITLTTSSLMLPIKSVSGIIGTGVNVKFMDYACARCEAEHCLYREKRLSK